MDGVNFYRLHIISPDGGSAYSIVKEIDQATASLQCWPNPFSDVIHITEPDGGKVVLKDMQGRVLYKKDAARGDQQIPAAALPPGLYFLQVGSVTYKMLHIK